MLTELSADGQITLPPALVEKLDLNAGDQLEVWETDGTIHLLPTVVYPSAYHDTLVEEVRQVKLKIAGGEQPLYRGVEEMLTALEGK